jgi:prepilin peptidase CpaA
LARPSDLIVLATLAVGAGLAAAIDLRTRRVPNPLTATLAALGLAFAACGISGLTVGGALIGLVVGFALMLPGHLFGATGAGDVKLFAAAGALMGPAPIITAFFYTAIAGGLLALVVAVRRRRLQHTLGATARLIATAAANAKAIAGPLEDNRFAYAPAIAVGTLIAALGR